MDIALSLVVLTAIALVVGSIILFRRPGYRKQAVLMLVLAGVMAINIAISTLPTPSRETLSGKASSEQGLK